MNWMKWNEKQKDKEKKLKRFKKFSTSSYGFVLNKYKDQNKGRRNR